MKYEKIITKSGRDIHVFDDIYDYNFAQNTLYYIENSYFKIGFGDRSSDEAKNYRFLCSDYSREDFEPINYLDKICDPEAKKMVMDIIGKREWRKTLVNLANPFEPHWIHSHDKVNDGYVALYYPNMEWHEPWAGETLIYEEDCKTVAYHSPYIPQRLLIFHSHAPHTYRAGSILSPQYRFTVATFLGMPHENVDNSQSS